MITHESIRFYILRNNAKYAEIFPSGDPTVRMNSSADIKMSLQGSFLETAIDTRGAAAEINWLSDEIQPVLTINGKENPIGVFLPAAVSTKASSNGEQTTELQAYDRCWRVRDTKVEGSLFFASGTRYMDAIEGLITDSGIGMILKTPTDAVLATDREDWEPGTSYLKIVNELLTEINYKPLWFDASGFAVLEPVSALTSDNIKRIYTDAPTDLDRSGAPAVVRMLAGIRKTTDVYQAPNVFVFICSNPDNDQPMTATAENTNPQSPLSTIRRGRRIVMVEMIDNIASQNDLQAYADNLLFESMTAGEVITIESDLLQNVGVNDVVAIKYDDLSGVCLERGWTMRLSPGGRMTHELQRVVLNIG